MVLIMDWMAVMWFVRIGCLGKGNAHFCLFIFFIFLVLEGFWLLLAKIRQKKLLLFARMRFFLIFCSLFLFSQVYHDSIMVKLCSFDTLQPAWETVIKIWSSHRRVIYCLVTYWHIIYIDELYNNSSNNHFSMFWTLTSTLILSG